jgi:hypothetical protein
LLFVTVDCAGESGNPGLQLGFVGHARCLWKGLARLCMFARCHWYGSCRMAVSWLVDRRFVVAREQSLSARLLS